MSKNLTIGIIAGALIVLGLAISAEGRSRGNEGRGEQQSGGNHGHQGGGHGHQGGGNPGGPNGTPDTPSTPSAPSATSAPSAPAAEQNTGPSFGADPDTRNGGGIGFCGRWPTDYYCLNGLVPVLGALQGPTQDGTPLR